MKKKFTFLLAALLLLTLFTQPFSALGQTYNLITSTDDLTTGDYVIAAKVGSNYYAMSNTFASKISGTQITVSDGKIIAANASGYVVTITKDDDGRIKIYNGSKYLNCKSSKTDFEVSTTAYMHDVEYYSTNGTGFLIHYQGTGGRGIIYRTSSYNQFGNYASVNGSEYYYVQLFKYTTASTPTVYTSTTELSGFSYVEGSGPSAQDKHFTVSGSNLGTTALTVTASENYRVCKTMDGDYTTSVSFTPDNGSVAESTVYVRLRADLSVGYYNTESDKITVASGAASETVTLSGRVVSSTTYAVTCEFNDDEGTLSASPTPAYETQTVTLTCTPESGFILSSLDITKTSDGSDTEITPEQSGDDYTFEMPAYAVTVTATFTENVTYAPFTGTLTEGDYLICDGTNAMNTTVSSNRLQYTSITTYKVGDNVNNPPSEIIWHIASSGDYWTIYNANVNKYAASTGKKSEAQILSDGTDDKSLWTASGSSTFEFVNKQNTANGVNANLRYNSGYGFACYSTSTGNSLTLYKRQVITSRMDVASVANGTITATPAGGSAVAEGGYANVGSGTEVTLSATPASGDYVFEDWDVYKTSNTSKKVTVTNNKFTMPGYPVTVSASFRPANTVTITYSVNGNTSAVSSWSGKEGTSVTLPEALLTGFVFKGRTDVEGSTALVSSPYTAPSTNKTLYAVFALENNNSITITSSSTNFPGGYTDSDYILEGKAFHLYDVLKSTTKMQFRANTGTIYNKENFGRITTVVINYDGSDNQKNCVLTAGTTENPSTGTEISPTTNNNQYTFDLSGDNYTHFVIVNGSTVGYLSSIVITYEKTYSTITNVTSTSPRSTDIEANELVIVKSPAILTFSGSNKGNSGNLIIEDGAQLICGSSIAATVKKDIEAPAKDDYGWYTISSPVHDGTSNVSAISSSPSITSVTYDMFAYKESEHKWLNQKAHGTYGDDDYSAGFSNMTVGQGYMYRSEDNTLSFVGNTNVGPVDMPLSYTSDLDLPKLRGFNLIGNPYTHSIAKGEGKAIDNSSLHNGCYVLSHSGNTWTPITDGNEIKPNQGVLVETSAAVADFQIQDINYVATPNQDKYNNDNIQFTVANSEYEDVAYAWFGKGYGLTKINHRDLNAPMLYIPQDGHNYAIATMSDDVKVFGLNFKTATMGQYTLSYKADGKFEYLHVIDLLAGEDVDMLLEGEYSFMGSPRDNENRFLVKLSYKAGDNEPNDDIFAYQIGNEVLVSGTGELQIFDVTGRKVMTTTINGAESISVPAQGVYIFRLVGNEIKTQKIVVR